MDDVVFSYADPASPRLKRGLINVVEAATGRRALKRLYRDHFAHMPVGVSFWQSAIRLLDLDVQFDRAALARIPRTGPVVIVANHPYGVLDGVVISWLVEQVRPDFKVLTHSLLLRAPGARPNLLPVDFSETPEAQKTNLASRAAARQHLAEGGCVVVFPAGGISTTPDRLGRRRAVDAPWQPFTAQLIQRSGATVVPIHFAGQNGRLFQMASHISLTLRLSLIFHEVKTKIGTVLPVTIGDPIPFERLEPIQDRHMMTDVLRACVDRLGVVGASAKPLKSRKLGRPLPAK
ncbi:lysophospholipid acyltransferase family protein [Lichenifustis flavocetrariae]|uniref:Lysophospholipid acyltransferase family protein n=1 Tax=Lichenifustis flavocetrariae TaxID=2949735 RepID=A0AA42CN21_9HYPH|nr:lysophospholipid acyltransferase family protein [Lichenifustis flavocetrariae]MCW6508957.1 lysophospholipid acyltransferase family protein [Lichenifustis flavocetrariae]